MISEMLTLRKYFTCNLIETFDFAHVKHFAQLHSTKPELRFCAGSNPARGVLEIRDGEDL